MGNKAGQNNISGKGSRLKGVFLAFALIGILTSCQQKTFATQEDLMAYVVDSDNGYTQKKSVNGMDFSITYKPIDLLVSQEILGNSTPSQIAHLRKKYREYMYFNVSLSLQDQEVLSHIANTGKNFGSMVDQLAFGMGDKVHLFSKTKDTLELADYVYPRLFGMGNKTTILFVYPRNEELLKHDYFHFAIEDMGFHTGEVRFKVPTKPILEEPVLKF